MSTPSSRLADRAWFWPVLIAVVAFASVVLTIDAAGDYPRLFAGPGITLDESFNVQMGVYQWNALREYNVALLHPESVQEVFGPGSHYNPDHPPLGRIWLGFWHDVVRGIFPPVDHPSPFVTNCARVGSAAAFALTVLLIGTCASRWYGRTAGVVAAVSMLLMPRLFAHAHLAALETFMNLTYSATILAVGHWWVAKSSEDSMQPTAVRWPATVGAGFLWGLALLTKMQAILLPPIVGVWALWQWRQHALKPLLIFGVVGVGVFFVGWPWLWLDPLANLREYFARTTDRATLHCYYLGRVWNDVNVPWHYPFVMFAVTVPIGLQVLGLLGLVGRCSWNRNQSARCDRDESSERGRSALTQPRERLLLLAMLFPLVLFALPGVAVYDGERLFSVSYPLWAVLIGRGSQVILEGNRHALTTGRKRWWTSQPLVLTAWLASQGVGVIAMHPCQLSYYNLLVGGLWGADRLGFERTYWSDSLTRRTLQQLCETTEPGATVLLDPVLHQFQWPDLEEQSPILRRHRFRFSAASDVREETTSNSGRAKRVRLQFSRQADAVRVRSRGDGLTPQAEKRVGEVRHGVPLSSIDRLAD